MLGAISENGEGRTYTVVLDSQPTETVTIEVDGEGFLVVSPSTLTFIKRTWNVTQEVTVSAQDDGDTNIGTNNSAFVHRRVTGGDYEGITADSVWAFHIVDTTVPVLSLSGARANEGSEVKFTASLDIPIYIDNARFTFSTGDGTATAGSDYVAETQGVVIFGLSETERTFSVTTINDDKDEADEETFTITLTNIRNAVLADGADTLTVDGVILDDDPTPLLSISGLNGESSLVPESVGSVSFTITLTDNSSEVVYVDYATDSTTSGVIGSRSSTFTAATEDADYTKSVGTLEFEPEETVKTVTVPVIDDLVSEGAEFFGLRISNPRNALLKGLFDQQGAGVVIQDDDVKGVESSPKNLTIAEGETGGATYTVVLDSEPTSAVRILVLEGALGISEGAWLGWGRGRRGQGSRGHPPCRNEGHPPPINGHHFGPRRQRPLDRHAHADLHHHQLGDATGGDVDGLGE